MLVILRRDGEDEGSAFAEYVHVFFVDLAVCEEEPGAVVGGGRCVEPDSRQYAVEC